jgi:hypothetical protein
MEHVDGTRTYFGEELRGLGQMSCPKNGVYFSRIG